MKGLSAATRRQLHLSLFPFVHYSGHITLWRGRICVQMIENAHKSRVTALDYNQVTLTLVSAALDGSICVISYSSEKGKAGGF